MGNVEFDGDISHDTPGSELIKSLLLDNVDTPVYLLAWGGQSTIARALKSIQQQYDGTSSWAFVRRKVITKAIIQPSGDQDGTYASYIYPNWPEIRYRPLQGGVRLDYFAQDVVSERDAAFLNRSWTAANVSSQGPLGARYRVWGDGKQMVHSDRFDYFGLSGLSTEELIARGYFLFTPIHEQGSFISEGDTPTFLNLIDNGLLAYRSNTLAGWGGHPAHGESLPEPALIKLIQGLSEPSANQDAVIRLPESRFMPTAQNDFAARLKWSVSPRYRQANHNPTVALLGPRTISARPGKELRFSVRVSDPDNDRVAVRWWVWQEAGSTKSDIPLTSIYGPSTRLHVPSDSHHGENIHLIAEAKDNGSPSLIRYAHVIITVR